MHIVADIAEDLDPEEWPETVLGERLQTARGYVDAFTEGSFMTVGVDPYDKPKDCLMARVAPPEEEVFDFRSFDCRNGIRVFGCFTGRDEFICLTWSLREDLAPGEEDWSAEIASCKAKWTALFGELPPHSGESIDDYFTHNAEFV